MVYIQDLVIYVVSGVHCGSWNISPADKGGLLYSVGRMNQLVRWRKELVWVDREGFPEGAEVWS